MKVRKATQEQYEALNGYQNNNDVLEFTKDGHVPPNWVINETNLQNPSFSAILPQLEELEQIDWLPPIYPDEGRGV